jgi:TonB-linked SusC/RagA family outer membrane protein
MLSIAYCQSWHACLRILKKSNVPAMKLTFVLMLSACLHISAKGVAQKISLSERDASLEKIFSQIERQTPYKFVYEESLLVKGSPVTIHVVDASIGQVLDACLTDQPFTYTILEKLVVIKEKAAADLPPSPPVDIKGKVSDDKGAPIPGASVTIKGTQKGTTTDEQGRWSLAGVNKEATLVFTMVGYKTLEAAVRGRSEVNVQMEINAQALGDVTVMVGYGTLRKRDVTGSSSGVSAKTISETPATTLENALQGRMAGVNITNTSAEPGGGINIQVRGATSISGSNQPLYVIDGVPQYNDNSRSASEINGFSPTNTMATLNPSDVESVEVLKDASSASIYGSRGANGVILITTKKGRMGKSSIDFGYYTALAESPKRIPLATAGQYAGFINLTNTNNGVAPYFDGTWKVTNNKQDSVYFGKPEEQGAGTDWQKEIFRNAMTQNFQMTMRGGNESVRYLISGNYLSDQGVVRYSSYKKGSIRANIDAKLNERLSATLNLNMASDVNDRAESSNLSTTPGGFSPSGVIQKAFLASPAVPADAQYYPVYLLLSDRGSSSGLINPLFDLAHTINKRASFFGQASMDLVYRFSGNFNFTVRGAYNNIASNNDMYWGLQTELGYDRGQKAFRSTWNTKSYINENFLTFNKNTSQYNLNVVVGTTVQKELSQGGTLGGELLPIPSDNGLYLIPLYKNISIPTTSEVSSLLLSGFGRMSFSYKNRYLLTLSGRGDGSSKFAENKKWAFFPSVGLGWNFSEENFMKGVQETLTSGKIRASYGTSGNQAISAYQSLSSLAPVSYGAYGGAVTGVVTNTSENKNLTWETTKQLDLGLDLTFAQNKFRVSFDLYRKTTDNLLQAKTVPSESGYSTILSNFGSIRNQGVELELGARLMQHKDFTWNADLNISANRNKILDLGEGVDFYNAASGQADYTHRLTVGGALGEFWGYRTEGLLTARDISDGYPGLGGSTHEGDLKFADVHKDGIINDADKMALGNAFPTFTLGLSNNFTYGSWSVNLLVTGTLGYKILNQNLLYSTYGSYFGVPTQKYLHNYWTPDNKNAYYPRPSAGAVNNVTSDRLIENGTNVRIKNLSLRYSFAKLPRWSTKAQVYLTASNLYTFTKYDGYDPEVSGYGQNILTPGIDIGSYPRTRIWTVGLDLGF